MIIIALAISPIFLFLILFFIYQNHDLRTKAQTAIINPATAAFPSKLFAPFVDTSLYPLYDFSAANSATGLKFYILAFITNSGSCSPAWGGTTPANSTFLYDQINFLRSNGGDVIISFGGQAGIELAQSCTTTQTLQAAYQQVITQYKISWIDMDIEGAAIADTASVDRRNKALAALQAANPGLKVSYTLPVLPSGLTQDGLNLLSNAKSNGVNIAVVNLMTMDYGDFAAPNPTNKMGQYAIQAVNSTRTQVQGLGITTQYGTTSMIGQNDTASEKFLLTDVPTVLSGAGSSDVSLLSMWSASRDNGGCPNQGAASPNCSGIAQSTYDFIKAFLSFMGSPNSPTTTTTTIIPTFSCTSVIPCVPSTTPTLSMNPTITNGIMNPTIINPTNTTINTPSNPTMNPILISPSPQINPPDNQNPILQLLLIFFIFLFKIISGLL